MRFPSSALIPLLVGTVAAQDFPPVPDSLASPSAHAPTAISKEQLAAVNARLKELRKQELLGDVLYFAGYAAWIPLVMGENAFTFSAALGLWAAHEAGLGMNFHANNQYRRVYREIEGEEAFLIFGGARYYILTRILTFGGAGLVMLGALDGDEDKILLGSAGISLGEFFSLSVWRTLGNSNRELSSGIRNWNLNLNTGITPEGGARVALAGTF